MTGSRPADILRQLAAPDATPDAELLARFVRSRDPAAFEALVRRHGPMVLAVCRRFAFHTHDAEDAFQAVFLVLARKAGTLTRGGLVGNWLYGVAVRVARRVRRTANRRRAREVQVTDMPEPPARPVATDDLGPVLHEELAALPEWYREPIVLCDLRGASRTEAAGILGIPEGTLSSRLANGRKKLAERLTRRGVALTAVAMAMTTVSDELVAKTCGVVAGWSAGSTVPAAVARLTRGEASVRNMLVIGVCTLALAAAGAVLAARPTDPPQTAEPPVQPNVSLAKAEAPVAPAAEPKPADEKVGFTTAPKMRRATDLPLSTVTEIAWSPNGKRLAVNGTGAGNAVPAGALGGPTGPGKGPITFEGRNLVFLLDTTQLAEEQPTPRYFTLPPTGDLITFTPDSKFVVTQRREYNLVSGYHQLTFWEPDRETFGPKDTPVPPSRVARARNVDIEDTQTHDYAFAADGKTFRTVDRGGSTPGYYGPLEVLEVSAETGKTVKSLLKIEGTFLDYVMSRNGKRLAVVDSRLGVDVWDVDAGKKESTARGQLLKDPRPFGGAGLPPGFEPPAIRLSADSRLLLMANQNEGPAVYDTAAQKWLPKPEITTRLRAELLPRECFSSDNRLLVLSGTETTAIPGRPGGSERPFLKVWEVETGKLLKSWPHAPMVGWNPAAPVLAVLEPNNESGTRLGLWDFAAEAAAKK